jgi:hypothetical protein
MKSFRLDGGDRFSIAGWLLLIMTVLVEFAVIGFAVELGLRDGRMIVSLVVGIAICVFMAGGCLLECLGVQPYKATVHSEKQASNDP